MTNPMASSSPVLTTTRYQEASGRWSTGVLASAAGRRRAAVVTPTAVRRRRTGRRARCSRGSSPSRPPPGGGPAYELLDVRTLEQAAGDPHDVLVRRQRRPGRVRVRGLAVVHPVHAVDGGDVSDPVGLRSEGPQPVAHRRSRYAEGA